MKIINLLPLIVFISYVSFIWIKYGVQSSISDSYYRLPGKQKILFTLFCWLFAYPMIIMAQNGLMYVAATFIMIVGASPAFKRDELVKFLHMFGAYGGVGFGIASVWVNYYLWYVSILFLFVAALLLIFKVKDKIWWTEIIAFLTIYFVVLFGISI